MREDFDDLIEEFLTEVRRFGTITSYKVPHYPFKEKELEILSDSESTDQTENMTDYER